MVVRDAGGSEGTWRCVDDALPAKIELVGGAGAGPAKVPAEVKKWKAVLAGAKVAQVGVSLQGGLLTFSGIEPEMVKKVGAALAKG